MARRYRKRSYRVPEGVVEEVGAELWAAGMLGLEQFELDGAVRLEAYFEREPSPGLLAGGAWRERGVRALGEEWLEERDWLARYRAESRPFDLAKRFRVDPGEPELRPVCRDGRMLLRLPARRAFGVGSHASTELAVEALEELQRRPDRVLDVGTGTGILSFAALALGARCAMAFDRELESTLVAHENRRLNDAWPALFAGGIDALDGRARFDLILLNVLPGRIDCELPAVVSLLEAAGTMIVSGLLEDERPGLEARYESLGLRVARRSRKEEWACLLLERRPR